MAWHDDSHVISCNGIIIWEAVTKPDVKENSGANSWNLRVAVDPNAPEIAELNELVQRALKNSKLPNVNLRTPGNHPISDIDQAKFPEIPAHYVCFSAATTQGAPEVCDINGADLQPMTYGPQLYNGAIVRLLVHAYPYDNKQKGINFGLDGVQIIDGKAPRLAIGAAGMSKEAVKSAFAGAGKPSAPPAAPGAVTANFPPEGWLAHPSAPGHFYKGQEVLTEAALRAKYPPAPPVAVQSPPPPPAPAASTPPPPPHTGYMDPGTPPPPPVAEIAFPPAGWWPHPDAPGKFYNAANEVLTEAQLRARG